MPEDRIQELEAAIVEALRPTTQVKRAWQLLYDVLAPEKRLLTRPDLVKLK